MTWYKTVPFALLTLAASLQVSAERQVEAAIHWNGYTLYEFDGHYYGLTTTQSGWLDTEAEVVSLGGHLVAINTAQEQQWLVETFLPQNENVAEPPVFWIGLTDRADEGNFVWSTGEPLTYTNWNDSRATGGVLEPNDAFGGEDFVAMNWHYAIDSPTEHTDVRGTWNDFWETGPIGPGTLVSAPYFGIFELNSNPVPEPSTLTICLSMGAIGLLAWAWQRGRGYW